MVLTHEDDDANDPHPYWYAQVIGVFHTFVRCIGMTACRQMDFLWVRWLGRDTTHQSGWKARCLHHVGFIHGSDLGAFGFLDPKEVIRAVHLIPAFSFGRTTDYLGPSIIRKPEDGDEDWVYFYVNV
jgi:hypothetical protein